MDSFLNQNNEELNFFFWLSVLANFCQLENYRFNLKDLKNTDLLKYLEHQDNDYLKEIIIQNELIIQQNKEILKNIKKGK